jgi:hypothetical protein
MDYSELQKLQDELDQKEKAQKTAKPQAAKTESQLVSPAPKPVKQETYQSGSQLTKQSISKPTDRTTSQSTTQSSKRLTKQSISQSDNKIVEKPKAFYITQRLDKELDEAVRYCQEVHGIKKADRSTIVNAILDNEANWTEEALDLMIDRVLSILTSRLTNR